MKAFYSAKEYWADLADTHGEADKDGFSPVLHPGTPTWFNETIDRVQEDAWSRALRRCRLTTNSLVLDVGCGTGRWLARYQERQLRPVGLDATQGMLKRAAVRNHAFPLVRATAQSLPFKKEQFELVSAVTVVQHIPPDGQRDALKEMARVLRPKGHLLLIDLIRGQGPHIFPRQPQSWIAEASAAGLSLAEWHGQEYLVLDRAFVHFSQTIRNLLRQSSEIQLPVRPGDSVSETQQRLTSRQLYWAVRKVTCTASEWLEPVAQKICPNEWATHGLFLFKK